MRQVSDVEIVGAFVGAVHEQGLPLRDLTAEQFTAPWAAITMPTFHIGRAAADVFRHRGTGVLLTVSTNASVACEPGAGGLAAASAAGEALTRQFAREFAAFGARAICLRPNGMPEAVRSDSHSAEVFGRAAQRAGTDLESMLASFPTGTVLGRSPSLAEVGAAATFFASDAAAGMTGTTEKVGSSPENMVV